ncbi:MULTISPECIES: phosphatase PAP2 family protein [unclassified Streptomyces]|uniref:phosphatase PAP2 family protein n=1 Tax=unclassified Streptomyces TaxID=2593676 RepID=UPI000DB9AEE7|nr:MULTISPECIES: phosphatase PAP2 family protein [unclassified Streptomyces]MYT68901.1 phosphatase PAP2 family protein [Streptomyces sp. SID8367]RAJ82406.1 undecaprenyl-diphosphatase [Streptomyces sp. PsTaAH-137]
MVVRAGARRLQEHRRRIADRRFALRLAGAAAVAALATAPFALLVVLVERQWTPLHRIDENAAWRLHSLATDHPAWTRTLRVMSDWVWDPLTLRCAVLAVTVWLLYRRAWRLAAWSATTAVTGGLIGLWAKLLVERARPSLSDPVAHAPGYSFPSGHAMTAATSCAILLLIALSLVPRRGRPVCWALAVVSVVGVGFTRVALGVHWFSDVVGGWLLGAAVVTLTTWAFEAWRTDAGLRRTPPSQGLEPELRTERPEEPETRAA